MAQNDDGHSIETMGEQPIAGNPSRSVGIDVRSRDAFELLKLGEAIVHLQGDLRNLRLEKEDLRFDRNRYQASATQYQSKLTRALDELDQARSYREETIQMRREVIILAQEFEQRLKYEQNKMVDHNHKLQTLHHEIEPLRTSHREQMLCEIAALRIESKAEYDNHLRNEIVSLSSECATKLADQAEALQHEMEVLQTNNDKRLQHEVVALRADLKVEYDNHLRNEIVSLSRECATKIADQAEALQHEMEVLQTNNDKHLQLEIVALRAELKIEHENRLRHEIVSLSRECAARLSNHAEVIRHDMTPKPKLIERWKLI